MDQAERHHVVDDIRSSSHILLPEKNGGNCSAAGGNKRAESHHKIHQRQCNGKSGDCHGAHSPSDEYTVDDVVDADGDTRDDGRNGILHKELANRQRASVVGSDCRGALTEAVCVELYDFDISAVLKRLPNGLPSFIIMQI